MNNKAAIYMKLFQYEVSEGISSLEKEDSRIREYSAEDENNI